MSIHEASIILGLNERTVRRLYHQGKITGTKELSTGWIYLHRKSVEDYINAL